MVESRHRRPPIRSMLGIGNRYFLYAGIKYQIHLQLLRIEFRTRRNPEHQSSNRVGPNRSGFNLAGRSLASPDHPCPRKEEIVRCTLSICEVEDCLRPKGQHHGIAAFSRSRAARSFIRILRYYPPTATMICSAWAHPSSAISRNSERIFFATAIASTWAIKPLSVHNTVKIARFYTD